jgi:hypothetical protein
MSPVVFAGSISKYYQQRPGFIPNPQSSFILRFNEASAHLNPQRATNSAVFHKYLPPNFEQFMQCYGKQPELSYRLQNIFSKVMERAKSSALFDLTTDLAARARLRSLQAPGSNCVLHSDLSDKGNLLTTPQFNSFIRSLLGMVPSRELIKHPRARCVCGQLLSEDPVHLQFCHLLCNSTRHPIIQNVLRQIASACGFVVNPGEHQFADSQMRADVSITDPNSGVETHIDVSVSCPSAPSYCKEASKKTLYAGLLREHAKNSKYVPLCEKEGAYFVPFVLESYGAMMPTVRQLLGRFADTAMLTNQPAPLTKLQMTHRIATALVKGNAALIASGLSRARFDGRL